MIIKSPLPRQPLAASLEHNSRRCYVCMYTMYIVTYCFFSHKHYYFDLSSCFLGHTKTMRCYIIIIFVSTLIAICVAQRVITIHGSWSPWSTVTTPCLRDNAEGIPVPVSCGGGLMNRKRSCTNPVPQVCN
jgi:hypothetical protein